MIRYHYQYDQQSASDQTAITHFDKTHTQQAPAIDCDINEIVRKWTQQGIQPEVYAREPQYGDVSEGLTYRQALDKVLEAQDAFNLVPPNIRARFHNDPAEYLDFLNDPSNLEEAIKLGLAIRSEAPSTPQGEGKSPDPKGNPEPPQDNSATPPK